MIQRRVIVRNVAENDILEAARWYEQRDQGLGIKYDYNHDYNHDYSLYLKTGGDHADNQSIRV